MATLYSNVDATEATGLVHVETQDGGGLAFAPTATTIPSGYKDIIITGLALGTHGSTDWIKLTLNSDVTDGNYVYIDMYSNTGYGGQGTASVRKWGGLNERPKLTFPSNSDLDQGTAWSVLIPDYANTVRHKLVYMDNGWFETSDQDMGVKWTRWDNTAAITSISYPFTNATNLAAGSSFTVWVR
jgi:hypothetical protein